MEEMIGIMKKVLEPPAPPSTPAERAPSRPRSARLAFRDILLGIPVPL
jgi:hypothetical protein